ncbi:MAG: hypothetical protein J6O55_08620 [Lachnospiraceae bacterium]|nr:hypothetical protein [Lachnospiraceae bacterium]
MSKKQRPGEIDINSIYVNKEDKIYNRHKTPKPDKQRECAFTQWKDYYIADFHPNLTENIINEPIESPITGETEFVTMNLLTVLSFGEISTYLADRIRTAVTKARLTGASPQKALHDIIIDEIELGDQAIISQAFKNTVQVGNSNPDTWWAEAGIK